ncbi:branched-chain amino acid ABC transporter permease [Brevibacterium sp. NPDC049920]|uniref:Branched-chain amino acid ABC transporter permease n=1 Tax=Brevibacterium pityocampae TaxID=506594 RepID=A0ABP8JEU0_9MICO
MTHDLVRRPRWKRTALVALALGLLAILGGFLAGPAAASAVAATDTLAGGTAPVISGSLRNEGEPLAGVRITATGDAGTVETTSEDDGRWQIEVPAKGTYSVELDESTLPDGVSLADGQENPREVSFGNTTRAGVIFQFGAGGGAAAAPAPSGADDTTAVPSSPPTAGETAAPGTTTDTGTGGRAFGVVLGERALAGLTFGLILALCSVGLNLILGTTGLNNFSHGETVTLGAVLAFAFAALGLPMWLAIIAAVAGGGLYGYLNDTLLWRPLRRRRAGLVPMMIVSIGFALTVRYILQFFFGGSTRQLPYAQGPVFDLGPFSITRNNLVSMLVALAVVIIVSLLLMKSKIGKATRAVADNPALASASGIDVDRVIRIIWITGAALAALGGILYAYYRPGVTFNMGQQILLMMFAAVTLGGLGTVFGALVGSLIVGIFVEISTIWLSADLKYVGALVIMILVLVFRPQGILGRKERIG